jgi:hypothetical protein
MTAVLLWVTSTCVPPQMPELPTYVSEIDCYPPISVGINPDGIFVLPPTAFHMADKLVRPALQNGVCRRDVHDPVDGLGKGLLVGFCLRQSSHRA